MNADDSIPSPAYSRLMTVLRIVLLCLCLTAVTAQVAFNILLVRMARQGKSGTEIIAMAFMPVMLVLSFVATPGGIWLAFDLAADAGSAPTRFGFGAVGSVLAAYLAVILLTAALQAARQRRDRRGRERVMSREETVGLIKSQLIAAAHRSPDGLVTVVYVDNRWSMESMTTAGPDTPIRPAGPTTRRRSPRRPARSHTPGFCSTVRTTHTGTSGATPKARTGRSGDHPCATDGCAMSVLRLAWYATKGCRRQ